MLIYALKAALAVLGGLVLWMAPVLQHWVVYLLWGPILGAVFCVGYAESVDYTSQGPIRRPDWAKGLSVAVVHVISVTVVWWFVTTKFAPLY